MPIGISFNTKFLPRIVDSLSDGDAKYLSKLPKLLRKAQKNIAYAGENGVVQETWCWNHLLSLVGETLRVDVPLLDDLVLFLVAIRSYFHMSDERITSLKMTCVEMGIRYQAIPDEFEVRFLAYLNNANSVFCAMCPAYMRYFNAKWEKKPSSKPAILVTITEKFAIPSFAYALKPVFEDIKKLDKTLQKYTLFPDEACEILDKFKTTLEQEARKSMSISQRNFYADNELK